jgi:hypothetical protein
VLFLKAWLLLPVLLAALSLGCGLLVERLSAARLPGVLTLPLGLATIVVVARGAVTWDATAELATPLVVVLALVGLAVGRDRLRGRGLDRWAVAAALVVFALFAAPIVLSGSATFAGYTILGDTAVHFALIDRISAHGTDVAGLPPSSYRTVLESYFASGYPLGAHAALGAVRPLAFLDVAWAFQPFLAFVMAMLALTLVGLLGGAIRSPWRRAAVAVIAAQPALAYGYALQGSIKEITTLWLVPLLAALVAALTALPEQIGAPGRSRPRQAALPEQAAASIAYRQLLPLALASAAAIAAIGAAAAAWLAPILLVALVVVWRKSSRAPLRVAGLAATFALGLLVLSVPTLLDLGDYLDVTKAVVTAQQELGNLLGPLPLQEVSGIWLSGDYRFLPSSGSGLDALELTYVLIGLAVVSGVFGVGWLVRRRALGPLLFVASSLVALWYVTRTGSPWADAKALAIASPAVLLAAALGPIALESLGARAEAGLVALALAAAVLTSNALAYHDVSLAPRERLQELADVGERTAGRGPLLYTEFEEFGKHFLRDSQPVGAAEGMPVAGLSPQLTRGGRPAFATSTRVGSLAAGDLERFNLIVMRRGPDGDRPPADWRREWSGHYYELWRRTAAPTVTAHLPQEGTGCRGLRGLARAAGRSGDELVATYAPPGGELVPADRPLPPGWAPVGGEPPLVQTVGPGTIEGIVSLTRTGTYDLWLSGSIGRRISVRVDGRELASVGDELAQPAGWNELARVRLSAGRHRVELVRAGGDLHPGNGDGPRRLGPLALVPARHAVGVLRVPPARWRELCGPRLLWTEAVASGG